MKIDQIAFATPRQHETILAYASTLGIDPASWVHDEVCTRGFVFGKPSENIARLAFNYTLGIEIELLSYTGGPNWLELGGPSDNRYTGLKLNLSHLGSHVTLSEMQAAMSKFPALGIPVAQHVLTVSHTNPELVKIGRTYEYVIFDTRRQIGFDLKLIRRIEKGEPRQLTRAADECTGEALPKFSPAEIAQTITAMLSLASFTR